MLAKGTCLTSAEHGYTKEINKVSFDDGDFNLASRDIINKYENRVKLNLSDKGKPSDNKDLVIMALSRTRNYYTSSCESQPQYALTSFNIGFNEVFSNTSVDAQLSSTIASSLNCQPKHIGILILNTDFYLVLFNSSVKVQMSRTNTRSFECQSYNAQPLLNTCFHENQPRNAQPLHNTCFHENQPRNALPLLNTCSNADLFNTSVETNMPQTITCSFENQLQNAQHLLFNTGGIYPYSFDTKTAMQQTITNSFENKPHNVFPSLNIHCHPYTSVETQMTLTIASSFENQPQNQFSLLITRCHPYLFDTSVETQMPQAITSSFENHPHNASNFSEVAELFDTPEDKLHQLMVPVPENQQNGPFGIGLLISAVTKIINTLFGTQISQAVSKDLIKYQPPKEIIIKYQPPKETYIKYQPPNNIITATSITSNFDYQLLSLTPASTSSGSDNVTLTFVIIFMLLIIFFILFFIKFRRICLR
jgi:hypothetical protein